MPSPYRIVDLNSYTQLPNGIPTGNELAEISQGGSGSFQIPIALLSQSRAQLFITNNGTFTIPATQYGDVLITTSLAVTINFPSALLRNGAPVSVIASTTQTPNITLVPFAGQTFFGLSNNLTITNPYGAYTLWPNASGLGDWYQK